MDGKIDISVGLAARSKRWKNKKALWSKLVEKLKHVHRTSEKQKEYFSATKQERAKIKDVGGYVGGYLRGSRRKQVNVVHRQLLTLDLDYAHMDFWDDFTLEFENAAVLHSTHSHSIEAPRFRLLIPLDREVTPDEYVPIARQVAGRLDIELFDNTTFETHRFMYWPSMSSDGDYYYRTQEGNFLNADDILDSYVDWTDSSSWPTSDKQLDDVERLSKKQEDPEFKKGIVGTFCRTYGIVSAIEEHLSEAYTPTAFDDRYTYSKGSTAAGLVLYDDKFAYSHHGTDPCSGKLCNAFDLVRVHLFGHLDTDGASTSPSKLPSYKAMEEYARKDKNVRGTLALERFTDDAVADFGMTEEEAVESLEWAKELEIDGRGNYLSSANNLNIIFANDPKLKGLFCYNLFDNKRYVFNDMPWRSIETPEPMRNVDYSGVRNYIEVIYGIVGSMKIDDALSLEFEKRAFHPIRDYLDGLEWDGEERVDSFLIDYFGVVDNIYSREAIRKTLVGAVARVYKAGIKFDLVLTLVGDQGTGKSTFVYKLGKGWFSDTFTTVKGKEAFEQLQGAWLIEMAELSGLRKAEVESIKHFITKQEDTYRPAYGKTPETYKRQCVFIGTTNNKGFLRDPSGNRRFMPIDVEPMLAVKDIFSIEDEEINQIWAEAKSMYDGGEKLYLSKKADRIAKAEQMNHRDVDERTGIIEAYLDTLLPEEWPKMDTLARQVYLENPQDDDIERQFVCVAEIWCECLNKSRDDMDRYKTRGINDILRSLPNWTMEKSPRNFTIYGKQKYYKRIKKKI